MLLDVDVIDVSYKLRKLRYFSLHLRKKKTSKEAMEETCYVLIETGERTCLCISINEDYDFLNLVRISSFYLVD